MAIVEIPITAFDRFPHIEQCRALWHKEHERAWFADSAGRVIGVLLHDPDRGLWSYSIGLRGDDGRYQRVAFAADIPTADMARFSLVAEMRKL